MFLIHFNNFCIAKRANYLLCGGFVHISIKTQWYLRRTKKKKKKYWKTYKNCFSLA